MSSDVAVPCLAFNHLNIVVEDFDGAVARLHRLVGAQFVSDLPHAEMHAGLVYFAGVLVELFAPAQPLITARYGDHYLGIEYQIPGDDVDEARQAVLGRGIRIIRDIGAAFHTHPADCFGVDFEFFTGNFHTGSDWQWLEPLHPRSYWENEHPLSVRGMIQYTLVVGDIEAAGQFLESFVGAVPATSAVDARAGTRTQTWQLADTTIELVAPTAAGPVRDHLDRYGDGISGIVLEVADLGAARDFLADNGVLVSTTERGALFDLSAGGGLACELVQR